MKKRLITLLIVVGVIFLGVSAIYWRHQSNNLKDKVEFYEKVMKDFGIEEFIHYPELYYEEGYTDQVKVHQCMWAIQESEEN